MTNHSRTVPTLELGNAGKPPMVFLHGWPDTSALWANQFEHFCGGVASAFFCVALSLFDYHPDVPPRPVANLFQDTQVAAFHRVLAEEMGLRDVTFVIFDWDAAMGFQFFYRYPSLVKRVVAMDIRMVLIGRGGLLAGIVPLKEHMAYIMLTWTPS